jgi:hypothetical protein
MSNLLPPKEKHLLVRMYRTRLATLFFVSGAALFVVGSIVLMPSLLLLKSDQIILTSKRDTFANFETNKIAQSLAATVSDINARLAVFPGKPVTASPLIAGLLDPALRSKTSAIHLTAFSYDPGNKGTEAKIKISGVADSRADLLLFAEKLKATRSFTNVTVPITSFIKDADVTFTASATVPVTS